MKYTVSFSGGAGSYCAAKRCISKYGKENIELVFCDTKSEDYDLYRFLNDVENIMSIKIIRIADGRDIWQVFRDRKFLGNSRIDPCSEILKRNMMDRYYQEQDKNNSTIVIGYGWDEPHRYERFHAIMSKKGWKTYAPMMDKPFLYKKEMIDEIRKDGIEPPRLYALGATHNNCGGGCVKAGQAHWKWAYYHIPDVFQHWKEKEQQLREYLNKDVSMMRIMENGVMRPLTLAELERKIKTNNNDIDELDFGACSCFSNDSDDVDSKSNDELGIVSIPADGGTEENRG